MFNLLDGASLALVKSGMVPAIKPERVNCTQLYAGNLPASFRQFSRGFYGIALRRRHLRDIEHDLHVLPLPFATSSCTHFQSEDVFEHLPLENMVALFDEVHRILQPGGTFRLSLPDYNSPLLSQRAVRDEKGTIVFDPGGGGFFKNGKVLGGGHLWFPTKEVVSKIIESTSFKTYQFLHYTDENGTFLRSHVDHRVMMVRRCCDFDKRVQSPDRGLSIIVDLKK